MPTRDEQDFERKRQHIIDGALDVFARKGFEKATNRDIAAAAGIGSPGLIYHYFKGGKAELFQQMLESRMPVIHLLNRSEEMMALPPREALTRFARALLQVTEHRSALAALKVMLGEATRRPIVAQLVNTLGPQRGFTFLSRYLARQMDAGVLRRMDEGAATRCFLGPLLAFLLAREVFPQRDAQTLDLETMVTTTVEIFLRGMEVRPPDQSG
jgi:AcrR family transcriptional regulator